jgi:DnaK suppressor protein
VNTPTYLDQYKQLLVAKQQELLAANGGRLVLGAAGARVGDPMDQAFAESEVMVDASLSEARSGLRRAIEWALVRLEKGNYGICAACGKPISQARLKAVPWTEYCRHCMEEEDD